MIDQILDYNKTFVAQKGYERYITNKYPDKKLAVLSCMDTRLTELLPAALGLKNGDAKIIKNAGGLVISAFDSAMRSLIVAIYELGVKEIMVVAHSHCGDLGYPASCRLPDGDILTVYYQQPQPGVLPHLFATKWRIVK